MSDDKNLRDQMNILFDDLDEFDSDVRKDSKDVKSYLNDKLGTPEEEEFTFDDFRTEKKPERAASASSAYRASESTKLSESEERSRRKKFEMDEEEVEEYEAPKQRPERKKAAASSAEEEKQKKYFWIFTAVIGALTLLSILFILISRGVFDKKTDPSKEPETQATVPTRPTEKDPTEEPSSNEPESSSESEPATEPVDPSKYEVTREKVQELEQYLGGIGKSVDSFMNEYPRLVIALPETSLNIRKEANTSSSVVAVLMRGAYANAVVDDSGKVVTNGDWIRIRSGSYEGWVSSAYVRTGNDAVDTAKRFLGVKVISSDGVNVRRAKNTSASSRVYTAKPGEVFKLQKSTPEDGFYVIEYKEMTCYISSNAAYTQPILWITTAQKAN